MNNEAKEIAYDAIAVGDDASFTITVSPDLVNNFAELSGDMNPLHMDDTYAEGTPFGHRIAHGAIIEALFSRLIGMHLPGKYSLYLSQTLRFHEPVPIDTEIVIRGEVKHKTDAHKTVSIRTTAEDVRTKQLLVSGDAMVQLLK